MVADFPDACLSAASTAVPAFENSAHLEDLLQKYGIEPLSNLAKILQKLVDNPSNPTFRKMRADVLQRIVHKFIAITKVCKIF